MVNPKIGLLMASPVTSRIVPRKPEPIALRFWYFKVAWSEFAVTVEGYRAKDESERELFNWRTTPVVQRITSRKLITTSGTTYILQGIIDKCALLALGYPRLLIKQFKKGFPPNWCEILRQFHSTVAESHLPRTAQWFNTSIVCGQRNSPIQSSKDSGEGRSSEDYSESTINQNRLSTVVPHVADAIEEGNVGQQQESHSQQMNEICKDEPQNPKERTSQTSVDKNGFGSANAIFKIPSIPAVSKRLSITKLYNWTVLFSVNDRGTSELFDDFGLVVEGFNEEQQSEWKTSCILAVNDAHHLQTASTTYELAGPINTVAAAQQGYPKEFVANFLNGFPENWRTIISEFFENYVKPHIELEEHRTRMERVSQRNKNDSDQDAWSDADGSAGSSDSSDQTDKQMEDSDSSATLPSSSKGAQKAEDKPSTSNKTAKKPSPKCDTHRRSKNRKETRAGVPLKKSRQSKKPTKQVTIAGEQPQRSGDGDGEPVKRVSRSGRLLKRPLASWAGERILYDIHGEPIESSTRNANDQNILVDTKEKKRDPTNRSKKPTLVNYSSSDSSDGDETYEHCAREPLTPFVGKKRQQVWHVISSSEEVSDENEVNIGKEKKEKRSRNKKVSKRKRGKPSKRANAKGPIRDKRMDSIELNVPTDGDKNDENESGSDVNLTEFGNSDNDNSGMDNNREQQQQLNQLPKRWKRDELERLKLAVRAIKPGKESDWEMVAKSLGGRTATDCLNEARKKLGWEPAGRRLTQIEEDQRLEELAQAAGKAKVGTLSYQVRAQRFTRKYVMGGGRGADFFEETMDLAAANMTGGMPSVVEFDPNDSLLDVMRTPAADTVKPLNRRRFIPRLTSPSDSSSSTSNSPAVFTVDSAERDRRERYVHQLLRGKNYNATFRSNASTMNVSGARPRRTYNLHLPTQTVHNINELDDENNANDDYFSSDDD